MLRRCRVAMRSLKVRLSARRAARSTPAWLRRFVRRKDGSAAVEFGVVLLPFLSILLMTMDTALMFFAQQNLETVAADSARLIMTGQAQGSSFDAAKFKTAVCNNVVALFSCSSGMFVDVQTYANFSAISTSVTVDSSGNPVTSYNPGAKSEIVVVRLLYRWPIVSPLAQPYLADTATSTSRLLVATSVFKNEPF
jgi:Flp pilus assembly protein TadG